MSNKTVDRVEVYKDDNVPEYMDGIFHFSDGTEEDHQELVDNEEFHSEEEMLESVAKRLGVHKDIVEVVN